MLKRISTSDSIFRIAFMRRLSSHCAFAAAHELWPFPFPVTQIMSIFILYVWNTIIQHHAIVSFPTIFIQPSFKVHFWICFWPKSNVIPFMWSQRILYASIDHFDLVCRNDTRNSWLLDQLHKKSPQNQHPISDNLRIELGGCESRVTISLFWIWIVNPSVSCGGIRAWTWPKYTYSVSTVEGLVNTPALCFIKSKVWVSWLNPISRVGLGTIDF